MLNLNDLALFVAAVEQGGSLQAGAIWACRARR
jgi:hypothetical protein